jgi:hypothetical protein
VPGWRAAPDWSLIDDGTAGVGAAERAALSTDARVAAWPPIPFTPLYTSLVTVRR